MYLSLDHRSPRNHVTVPNVDTHILNRVRNPFHRQLVHTLHCHQHSGLWPVKQITHAQPRPGEVLVQKKKKSWISQAKRRAPPTIKAKQLILLMPLCRIAYWKFHNTIILSSSVMPVNREGTVSLKDATNFIAKSTLRKHYI